MKFVFASFALFVIFLCFSQSLSQSYFRCRDDEVFDNCISNCGPPRCSNILNTYPCTNLGPLCTPGCKCKDGRVYDNQGRCVLQTECFQK
uniref:Venom peptide KAPi n=1 Tax=Olivierus martensii TaxID=34649 RepID=A0A088BCZ3_OLIMR|nr:putative anticoagulant peptide AP1 [Mesobuthus martensii]AGV98855.1 venom peptide KAPi precursor [Mesobuthus martensii]